MGKQSRRERKEEKQRVQDELNRLRKTLANKGIPEPIEPEPLEPPIEPEPIEPEPIEPTPEPEIEPIKPIAGNIMYNKILTVIVVIVALVLGIFYFTTTGPIGSGQLTSKIGRLSIDSNENNTSTEFYLFSADSPDFVASTTWAFESNRLDEENRELQIQWRASSSASLLRWQWETSYDGIDWYPENRATSTNTVWVGDAALDEYKPVLYERDWLGLASTTMNTVTSTTIPSFHGPWDKQYVNYLTVPIPYVTSNNLRITVWDAGADGLNFTSSTIFMRIPFRDIGQ